MSVQPWMIKSWPIVEWYPPESMRRWPPLRHVWTQTAGGDDVHGRQAGQTVWVGSIGGQSVGLAWDWAEVRPGVVALSDPNAIVTNLRFMTAEDTYQERLPSLIMLNRMTHRLAWHEAVSGVLRSMRTQRRIAS
jgi:hypothetical protein